MKKKIVNKLLAAALCASMVGSLAPASFIEVAAAQVSQGEENLLAEEEEVALGFEQEYAQVNQPLKAVVKNAAEGTKYTYQWTIGGKVNATITGDTYTPSENDLEKFIEVTARDTTGKSYTSSMYFSKLPVVYVDTDNQPIKDKVNYVPGTFKIQGNEKYNSTTTTLYDGTMGIRGRGNSTWGMPKKPYKVKLDDKTNIFGMGKNKHWTLLANYIDPTLSKNKLSYDFSGEMGMPFMQSENVVLVMNGKYAGAYQLCEQIKIDSSRVDITDWESLAEDVAKAIAKKVTSLDKDELGDAMKENLGWVTSGTFTYEGTTYNVSEYYTKTLPGIDGGYLIEMDEYFDEYSKFYTSDRQPIMFKSPEFVATNSEMIEYVRTYINAFESAINSDDGYTQYDGKQVHYTELYDMDSLTQFWLVNELFFNEDAMKKSTYMYKDNDDLMKMGPIWDMDWAAGGLQGDSKVTNQWQTLYFRANAQANQWYKKIVKDPYFAMRAYELFHQQRAYMGEMVAQAGKIDTNKAFLQQAGIANDSLWRQGAGYVSETENLKAWLTAKLKWMDTQFASVDTLLQSLNTYNSNQSGTTKLGIDSVTNTSEGIEVSATLNSGSTNDVIFYVNGIKCATGTKDAQGKVTVTIPTEKLDTTGDNMLVARAFSTWATYTDYEIITPEGGDVTVNKDALITALNQAKEKLAADYTEDSFALLQDKIAAAEEVKANESATQSEVNTALAELNKAINALVPVEEPTDPTEPTELPTEGMTATAGNEETTQSKDIASNVLDGDTATIWHTNWNGTANRDDHYITIDLGDEYEVSGIKATPRQDSFNGIILSATIQTSMDGVNFTDVATNLDWKSGDPKQTREEKFKAVKAKYVRLISIESYAQDPSKLFSSLAELRVMGVEKEVTQVNKEVLETAVTEAKKYSESMYTTESFKALTDAITAAELVIANEKATQAMVNSALKTLNTAIENLDEVTITKAMLKTLIDEVNALDQSKYTPASVTTLVRAINEATKIYNNNAATSIEVEEAYEGLSMAKEALKLRADKAELLAKINLAKTYVKSEYTEVSFRLIEIALDYGQKTYDDVNATQEDVNARVEDFNVAIDGLERVTENEVDKTALNAAIEEADALVESKYTTETWKVFAEALAAAKIVQKDEEATEANIEKAIADLATAKSKLVEKTEVDKTALNAAIKEADALVESKYTKPSWKGFAEALAAAKIVQADEQAKESAITNAIANLTTAKNNLVRVGWNKDSKGRKTYINADGKLLMNTWKIIDGKWYYFNKDQYMQTNWIQLRGTWYYLETNGQMVTGWKLIDKKWYLFNKDGMMLTGWQKDGKSWYYMNKSGKMLTGWQKDGKTWYYMNKSGKMLTGWQKISNVWYLFNDSGKMITGWKKSGRDWYFMNSNGSMRTGWLHQGKNWYYLTSGGQMVTGWYKIDGKYNYFNNSGVWTGKTR